MEDFSSFGRSRGRSRGGGRESIMGRLGRRVLGIRIKLFGSLGYNLSFSLGIAAPHSF